MNYEWWESIYDDAERIGLKIKGFDIDRGSYCKGEFITSTTECANTITAEHGETCETYKTAIQFLEDWQLLVAKYSDGIKIDQVAEGNEYEFDMAADELEGDFLQSILEDYRILLSKEYDYLTSEDAIKDAIVVNGYEFTIDGYSI